MIINNPHTLLINKKKLQKKSTHKKKLKAFGLYFLIKEKLIIKITLNFRQFFINNNNKNALSKSLKKIYLATKNNLNKKKNFFS